MSCRTYHGARSVLFTAEICRVGLRCFQLPGPDGAHPETQWKSSFGPVHSAPTDAHALPEVWGSDNADELKALLEPIISLNSPLSICTLIRNTPYASLKGPFWLSPLYTIN